ncbi:hypothetical protein [Candidatus Vondammii sp. HM_W22]|uniref:hypothetical protein n=1 Tax=Candidatus Vondammii sp. HM_W22 TaxID=2687299 RepID=UPI002402969A|nr:hypothetical protein [Candidatus Vondammii sp. HM_W22]
MAILGQLGTGKSGMLQRTVKTMPHAYVVLLELHGEYVWRDSDGSPNPHSMRVTITALTQGSRIFPTGC